MRILGATILALGFIVCSSQDKKKVDSLDLVRPQHEDETTYSQFMKMNQLIDESNRESIEIPGIKLRSSPLQIQQSLHDSQEKSLQDRLSEQQYFDRSLRAFGINRNDVEEMELLSPFKLPAPFDSRIDIHQLDPEIEEQYYILQRTNDIFCIIHKDLLKKVGPKTYQLNTSRKLGAAFNLCDGQPYVDQPSVGLGTAFLVRNDLIITANHVLKHYPLEDYRLINRFEITAENGDTRTFFHEEEIYRFQNKLGSTRLDPLDIALVQLNRESPFNGSQIRNNVQVDLSDQVYSLGHPIGLPLKLTINARVKELNAKYLYTSLDTFQGNSGSPVYLRDTHQLIGVLVAGGNDFEPNGDCLQSYLCIGADCGREKVLNINYLLHYIKDYLD